MTKKTKAQRRKGRQNPPVHPLIVMAKANGAKLDEGTFEVAEIGNPYGEVVIRGEIRRHKVVRRVLHYEALHKAGKIDRATFACLDWFADRLALANSGLVKCGLNVSGGGGVSSSHIPTNEAAMQARSDVAWARRFIRDRETLAVFDLSMEGQTFDRIGPSVFPALSVDTSKRKASKLFNVAAGLIQGGVAPLVMREGK